MKINAVLAIVFLTIFTSACSAADAQAPIFTPSDTVNSVISSTLTNPGPSQTFETGIASPIPSNPTPSDTPQATPLDFQPYQTFNLTLINPSGWDTHIFVDNVYVITVGAGDSTIYNGLKGGERTVHFCQVKDILTCEPPKLVFINGDLEWVIGEELPKSIVIKSGPMAGSTPVPLPVILPPQNHKIKVNNRTPWQIYIFIQGQIRVEPTETPSLKTTKETGQPEDEYAPFLVIPVNSHRTYDGLTTGTYTFIHCIYKTMKSCFDERTIVLDRDTEWFVYP